MTPSSTNAARQSSPFWALTIVIFVYALLGAQVIERPGLYMDEINPDYLAVRLVNPSVPTAAWIIPGNYFFDRFPLMAGGLYHGSLHAYLAVPFYLIFGGTILSIRISHMFLAISILIAAFTLLRAATLPTKITIFALFLLATDSAFIFAFRTLAYITTFPICLVMVALSILISHRSLRAHVVAGATLGYAIWCYFIFAFFLPGVLVWIFMSRNGWRPVAALLVGCAIGASPYAVGYAFLFHDMGWQLAVSWLRQAFDSLHVESGQPYWARVGSVLQAAWSAVTSQWHREYFWGAQQVGYVQAAKAATLIAAPIAALPFARGDFAAFRLLALTAVSFLISATAFGGRMGGYHFNLLVPLLYVLAAMSISVLTNRFSGASFASCAVAIASAVLVVNTVSTERIMIALKNRGAVGLYSDVISNYPKMALSSGDRTAHVFIDWGAMLQFIYLTEGLIPTYDQNTPLATILCHHGSAKIVSLGEGAAERTANALQGREANSTEILRDPHSQFVYRVTIIKRRSNDCK
jgi:hypothetical protein